MKKLIALLLCALPVLGVAEDPSTNSGAQTQAPVVDQAYVDSLVAKIREVEAQIAVLEKARDAEKDARARAEDREKLAVAQAPETVVAQIAFGEVLRSEIERIRTEAQVADMRASIDATKQVPLKDLIMYLPPARIAGLVRMKVTHLTVELNAAGAISYVRVPSAAGHAPLHWKGTGIDEVEYLKEFARHNRDSIRLVHHKVAWDHTKPGIWKVKVVPAAQRASATPTPKSPPKAHASRGNKYEKVRQHARGATPPRFSEELRRLAAEELRAMGKLPPAPTANRPSAHKPEPKADPVPQKKERVVTSGMEALKILGAKAGTDRLDTKKLSGGCENGACSVSYGGHAVPITSTAAGEIQNILNTSAKKAG